MHALPNGKASVFLTAVTGNVEKLPKARSPKPVGAVESVCNCLERQQQQWGVVENLTAS